MKLFDEKGNVIPEITSAGQPVATDPADDAEVVVFTLPNQEKDVKFIFGIQKDNKEVEKIFEEYCENFNPTRPWATVPNIPNVRNVLNALNVRNVHRQNQLATNFWGDHDQIPSHPRGWLTLSAVFFVYGIAATTTDVHEDDVASIVFLSISALLFLRAISQIHNGIVRSFTATIGAHASLIAGVTLVLQNGENPDDLANVVGIESLALYALFCGVTRYAARENWDLAQIQYAAMLVSSGLSALILALSGLNDKHIFIAGAGVGLGAMTMLVLIVWLAEIERHRGRQERFWNMRDEEEIWGENTSLLSTQRLYAYQRAFRGLQPYDPTQSNIQAGSINNDLDLPNHANAPSHVPESINISRVSDNRPS